VITQGLVIGNGGHVVAEHHVLGRKTAQKSSKNLVVKFQVKSSKIYQSTLFTQQ